MSLKVNQKNSIFIFEVYLIFVLILLKLIFGFYLINTNPDFLYTPDSESYILGAQELCKTGKFYWNSSAGYEPMTFRTPGMSIILMPAICLKLSLKYYIIFLNCFMIILAAYLTLKILKLMKVNTSSLLIFSVFLIEPTLTRYQFNLLTELVFLFFFTIILYCFIYSLVKKKSFFFFLGFFFITCSTFIRPLTLYLPYYLIILIILLYILNKSQRHKLGYKFLIVGIVGVFLHFTLTHLWSYRNYKVAGVKEFATVQSANLYYYLTAGINAEKEKRDWEVVRDEYFFKTKDFSPQELSDHSKKEIIKAIINNPIAAIKVGLKGSMMTFLTPGTGQYARLFKIDQKNYSYAKNLFITFGMLWIMTMWALSVYGFVKINKDIYLLFLLSIFIYLMLFTSSPASYSRFRIPFIPILIIFMSVGFNALFKNLKKTK